FYFRLRSPSSAYLPRCIYHRNRGYGFGHAPSRGEQMGADRSGGLFVGDLPMRKSGGQQGKRTGQLSAQAAGERVFGKKRAGSSHRIRDPQRLFQLRDRSG